MTEGLCVSRVEVRFSGGYTALIDTFVVTLVRNSAFGSMIISEHTFEPRVNWSVRRAMV